jgi:hypothetical protein
MTSEIGGVTLEIGGRTLAKFLEDVGNCTKSIIECAGDLNVYFVVAFLSEVFDESQISTALQDVASAIKKCKADRIFVSLCFHHKGSSLELERNVGKAFTVFISQVGARIDLELIGHMHDCMESFILNLDMQSIISLECDVNITMCRVLRTVLIERPQPPTLSSLRLDFHDWGTHHPERFPLETICDILEKTSTRKLIVKMTDLGLNVEYVDALLIALSKNPHLTSLDLTDCEWNIRHPDANGPVYLSRCILKLLESRTNWTDCTIDISHIHVDDEFWKRCATCLRTNIGHLTFKLGRIPLDLDTANQYNQIILQDREIRDKCTARFRFLSNPWDSLPMELIDAFKVKLNAEEIYLGVVESMKKRPRIRLSQQAAAEPVDFDVGVNVQTE